MSQFPTQKIKIAMRECQHCGNKFNPVNEDRYSCDDCFGRMLKRVRSKFLVKN